jgi:hypothetical protein
MGVRVVGLSRVTWCLPVRAGGCRGRAPWWCDAEASPAATVRTPLSKTHLVSLGLLPSAFLRVASKIAPPSTNRLESTPAGPRARFGESLPRGSHVPSSWVLTTSTASSSRRAQACCILLPTMGFTGFWPCGKRRARRPVGPPHRCHTLQSLPLHRQPCLRHRRPLPPRR